MTGEHEVSGQIFASDWDGQEVSLADAANMRLRSDLMTAERQAVAHGNISLSAAARRLELTQPRLNDPLRGRINKLSLDALVLLAARAGRDGRLRIEPAAA